MSELFASHTVAVITGAASGIGAAAARRFADRGMKLVLFDQDAAKLGTFASSLKGDVLAQAGDVSKMEDVEHLREAAYSAFGRVDILMNNAGIAGQSDEAWRGLDAWRRVIDVNLWGVINNIHAFTPAMLAQGGGCAVIITGSKQGITNPPGHPAYAVSKSGVKTLAEQLAYALRQEADGRVTAHLLVPGWTFTGMRRNAGGEKPEGAWTAEQVVDLMVARVIVGDFYIICPDNAVSAEVDAARIRWSAEDLAQNRPALSRWHPDWTERFEAFMAHQLRLNENR